MACFSDSGTTAVIWTTRLLRQRPLNHGALAPRVCAYSPAENRQHERPGGSRGGVNGAGGATARHPRFFAPIVGFLARRVLAERPEAGVPSRSVPPAMPFILPIPHCIVPAAILLAFSLSNARFPLTMTTRSPRFRARFTLAPATRSDANPIPDFPSRTCRSTSSWNKRRVLQGVTVRAGSGGEAHDARCIHSTTRRGEP